jgi:hypothetical protein
VTELTEQELTERKQETFPWMYTNWEPAVSNGISGIDGLRPASSPIFVTWLTVRAVSFGTAGWPVLSQYSKREVE